MKNNTRNNRRTRRNKIRTRRKTRRHTRNKAKIIHKQSGGIILLRENNIISQIPVDYIFDLDNKNPYIRYDNYIDNVLRLNEALPLFQTQISRVIPESNNKCKVYIIFTFMQLLKKTIKILHPIICITGTHKRGETINKSEISILSSTYEFNEFLDLHTSKVCKSRGIIKVPVGLPKLYEENPYPENQRTSTLRRTRHLNTTYGFADDDSLRVPNSPGRLGHDKIRALGFVGYFENDSDAIEFKAKLDADNYFTGDPHHRDYDILNNNCQHFVVHVLKELKEEKEKFVPAIGINGYFGVDYRKTMLDLDIMQGGAIRVFLSKLSATELMGSVGSSVGSVTGSSVSSSVSSSTAIPSAVPVSSVVGSTVAGAAAGVAVGNRLEAAVRVNNDE